MMNEIPAIAWDTLLTSIGEECYLGKGSFSNVYHCYHKSHGDVAVKILNTKGNAIRALNREGKVHLQAHAFPHILRLLGITQQNDFVGLVLEYMPYGNLASLVFNTDHVEIPWNFRLRALSEAAAAMAYLHNLTEDRRVIHCDLKVENILLTSDLHVKISDFGGASFQSLTGTTLEETVIADSPRQDRKKLFQYTLSYAAPELLSDLFGKRTIEMDVYSFGIVIYVVMSKLLPFPGINVDMLEHGVKRGQRPKIGSLEKIESDPGTINDVEIKNIFALLCHIMELCWKQNPKDRLNMTNVRDSFVTKLNNIGEDKVMKDVFLLKQRLPKDSRKGEPKNPVSVYQKYQQIRTSDLPTIEQEVIRPYHASPNRSPVEPQFSVRRFPQTPNPPAARPIVSTEITAVPSTSGQSRPVQQQSPQRSRSVIGVRTTHSDVQAIARSLSQSALISHSSTNQPSQGSRRIQEIESNFADPYFRDGNDVIMITDIAAIKNAQVGHGGWNESLNQLCGTQGNVRKVEDNGDVIVSFSGVRSHRFNPSSLMKMPTDDGLHVGDFVVINCEVELVKVLQDGHGGWVDDMENCFKQLGLLFRFLPDRDVLVVYKDGRYFRFNPLVLSQSSDAEEFHNLRLPENPDIRVGDYCYHDLEDEVMKVMQSAYGGWNDAISEVRGKVGKFVYVDYHGRAFVAYTSKLCFMLNPGVIHKLTREGALLRFAHVKDEAKRTAQVKAAKQVKTYHFAEGDHVRIQLPLDLVIELQKGHGGWCYKMLEVYCLIGVVKSFDDLQNVQVVFDTGNKWTFNSAVLDPVRGGTESPSKYVPPFLIGDKVRVNLEEVNNLSLNEMEYALKEFDVPEEKVALLKKTGEVLGIDDDLDVIVSFGDERRYGLKPEQLKKI